MHARMVGIAAAAALLVGCSANSATTHQSLTMEQTPITVRRGIEKAYPDAKVAGIERETDARTRVVRYQVKAVTAQGEKVSFDLAEDGSMLEQR